MRRKERKRRKKKKASRKREKGTIGSSEALGADRETEKGGVVGRWEVGRQLRRAEAKKCVTHLHTRREGLEQVPCPGRVLLDRLLAVRSKK